MQDIRQLLHSFFCLGSRYDADDARLYREEKKFLIDDDQMALLKFKLP